MTNERAFSNAEDICPRGITLDKLTFYLSLIFLLPGIYSFFYKVRLGFKVNSSKFYGPDSKTINFDNVKIFPQWQHNLYSVVPEQWILTVSKNSSGQSKYGKYR